MTLIKIKANGFYHPVEVTPTGNKLFLKFRYNEKLIAEIKVMAGARWHPDSKEWSIHNSDRNRFQLMYLGGGNPYAKYDAPLVPFTPRRSFCGPHQIDMSQFALTRHYCVISGEMGVGKTLAAIETIEASGFNDWWWIGPKNAIFSVKNEFKKWTICDTCNKPQKAIKGITEACKCNIFISQKSILPRFLSFEELKKIREDFPKGLFVDEASRCKNPTAQRTAAVQDTADKIREKYKDEGFVVLMSGSCAPKDPTDWWSVAEIARPGFLREGNVAKFRQRLCVIEQRENLVTGGTYPQLVTWLDNPRKCSKCGQVEDHPFHNLATGGHTYIKSIDEVSYLYKRLSGLVLVKLKKECLKYLPDKIYETIELEPTAEMKRAASIIEAKCPTTIQALTLLRELSDGFQYKDEDVGLTEKCPRCLGSKIEDKWIYCGPEEDEEEHRRLMMLGMQLEQGLFEKVQANCDHCSGTGEVVKSVRVAKEVATPKEAALRAQLDLHEEVSRLVTFGGFTGSIDRIVNITKKEGWHYIRVDGRGWESDIPGKPERLLEIYQEKEIEKINFIAHPASGGLGLNLTASPTIVYWSNDFNSESRIQSEDRIHRPGMDLNLGAKIIDFICLKTDLLVLNNLQRKRRLQDLTLGQMREEIATIKFSDVRNY